MKVSVALHPREPDAEGNQRIGECRYGGYNRQTADMVIDPNTGAGLIEIRNMNFPNVATDPETVRFFSIGRCFAPEGWGGAVIIAGQFNPPIDAAVDHTPQVTFIAAAVEPERMKTLGLVVQERTGGWREKSETELRATMDGVR